MCKTDVDFRSLWRGRTRWWGWSCVVPVGLQEGWYPANTDLHLSRTRVPGVLLVGLGRRAEPLSVLGIVPGVDSTSIPLRFHFDSSRHGRVVRHADPPAPTSLYTRGRRGPHAPHGHASPLRNREGACVPRSVCAPTLHRGVCSHSGRDHGTRPPRPTRTTTPRVRLRRSCPRSQPPRASSAWPRCCSV